MKLSKAIAVTFRNVWLSIKFGIKNSFGKIGWLMLLALPYVMMVLGGSEALRRGNISIGGEIVIPLIIVPLAWFLISLNSKLGNGYEIPLPEKRFTEIDDDEVRVDLSRQPEMLLWVAEIEDWAERMGLR